ncbi:MAG: hypothetical protein L6R42_003979 [Xanthoria sp. 1 TBL-2021]|nr:MAG: hypothetical protein L6R42_003979 [Xanthoria sp. 1 TBL-2021]
MDYDCKSIPAGGPACTPNAGISKFNFTSGKTHRLRLINAGAEGIQRFSIDNHTMKIGQRTDVLVKANLPSDSAVFMRSNIPKRCSAATQPLALAAIYYEKANRTGTPKSTPQTYDDSKCGNDDLSITKPLFPFPALPNAATTLNLDITFGPNATGFNLWYMNNETPPTPSPPNGPSTTSAATPPSASSSATATPQTTPCISTATISSS